MEKKVKAKWHPTDKSHSRTDDDWKRIMAEPYVTKTEEEEKKKGEVSRIMLFHPPWDHLISPL